MSNADFVTVPRQALIDAMGLVPESDRGEFALRLLGLHTSESYALHISNEEPSAFDDKPRSYALTVEQARQLVSKIQKLTTDVIRAAVTNVKDGVGVVYWTKVKDITGVTNWAQFSQGRLGGLNRALRGVNGQPGTVLLWEDDVWMEDGKGDYSYGKLCIDGPAVRSLQIALGIKPE